MSLGNYELVQPYIDDKNGTRLIGITSSSPASVRQPQVLPPQQQQQQLHPNAQSAYPYSQVYHIDLVSTSKSNMKLNCNAFSNHLHTTGAIMSDPQTANPRTTDGVVIRVSSLLSMTLVLNQKKKQQQHKTAISLILHLCRRMSVECHPPRDLLCNIPNYPHPPLPRHK